MKRAIVGTLAFLVVLAGGVFFWWSQKPWLPYHDSHLADGAKVRLLQGSLRGSGALVLQMWLPSRYLFPAHFHDVDEQLKILSGQIYLGGMDGGNFDCAKASRFREGNVHVLKAGVHHWGFTMNEPVLVEIRTRNPYALHWVDAGPMQVCDMAPP